jgi:hypothetical protein
MRTVDKGEAKPNHKKQRHPLVSEEVASDLRPQGFCCKKKISGRDPQETWR